ncbi:MAG: HEPN domain-containing protein [Paludibacter sp.]|nr:HEPN domain-containing protein [Paludibacter sp.]
MSLTDEERDAVVFYRIQKAKETWKEAEGIAQLGYWNAVINRLYYACYYMTSALLIYNGHTAQTHAGVIRLFGLNFVIKGIVSKEQSRFYSRFLN